MQSDNLIYEKTRRLSNFTMWTIEMQLQRLTKTEAFDDKFVLRKWADFHFLVFSIVKLRNVCKLALKSNKKNIQIKNALKIFNAELPFVKTIQKIEQHIDEYLNDEEKIKSILNKQVEVGLNENNSLIWLGHIIELDKCHSACIALHNAINEAAESFK